MKKTLLLTTFIMLTIVLGIKAQTFIEIDKTLPIPHPLPTENYYYGYSTAVDGDYAIIGAYNANSATGVAYVLYFNGTTWEHQAKLTGSDCDASDYFGYSVSISGDNVVIGAWQNTHGAMNTGAAYVFTKPAGGWEDATETVKLVSDDISSYDYFGRSVSIDGNAMVVGAISDDDNGSSSGSAYVFTYDGSVWARQKKLLASDGVASDNFGGSVSISGNNIVVGANRDDDTEGESGSAYVFTNPGTGWADATQTAKLNASDPDANDLFGSQISIFGDNIIVGVDNKYYQQGAVYLFTKPASGWTDATETEKFEASDASSSRYFGSSVSISGDNMIIGSKNAYNSNSIRCGAAYVFENNSGTWSETAKLTPSTGAASDYFGCSASISGDNIVVGAYQDDDNGNFSGAAFLFVKPATEWTNMTETATSLPYGEYSNTDDEYGNAIAIDGNYAVVGASHENSERGGAYVLYYNGTEWVTQAKLTASDGATNDEFGCSVAIDGVNIVIGAYEDGNYIGAAYVFTKPVSGWADATEDVKLSANLTSSRYGYAVEISDDKIFVGAYGYQTNKGCVYVYSYNGSTWTLSSTLTASDGISNDYFGSALSVSGDNLIVSAYAKASYKGAAYLFTNNSGTWSQTAKLTASDAAFDDYFSRSVAINDNNITIGASGDESGTGAVYIFEKPETGWADATETLKITASDGVATDFFGTSVDIEGKNMIVGAYYNDDGTNSGAAYLFTYNGTTWIETEKYSDAAGTLNDYFGAKVFISGDNIAIGSRSDDDNYDNSGSVHFYKWRIKEQPASQTDVCPTSTVSFAVETNFTETLQWQLSVDNGISWFDLEDDATYSNTQTDILTVNVNPGLDDYQYRCLLSNATYGEINTDTALLTVIVDNENPLLTVQNLTIYVDDSGNADISASDVVTSATDNCFIADTTLSKSAFNCSNIGTPVTVDVTLSDVSGNEVIEQAIITVEDNINPILSVQNYTLQLNETGNAFLLASDVVTNADDNCSIADTTLSQIAFDCSNIGTPVTINVTLSDESGNETTEQAIITVVDNVNPSLTVQDYTLELDATGNVILYASDVVTSATDNCSLADTTLSKTNFDCSNIGTPVNVDITLIDESGNEVTKQVVITVEDNVAPVLSVQNHTLQLNSTGEVTLKLTDVVINTTDNCSLADTTLSQTDFYCSNIGTPITVDVTLFDESGNSVTETVTVTVVDNIAPVLEVQNHILSLDITGNATLKASDVVTSSSDNCSLADTTLSKSAFDCTNVGSPVNIDITLNDVSGNSTVKTITVTVQDAISPGLSVQNHTLQLDATGNATLKASDVVTDAYDDCTIADTTLSKTAFDCSDIGNPVNVDVTVSDVNSNSTTYPVTITVVDNVDPVLSVQNHTLQLDGTGNAKLTLLDVVIAASDNCSLLDTTLSKTTFDCSNIGTPVNIDVTLSDESGNAVTETVTITVVDNVAPVLEVQNRILSLDITGNATLKASDVVTSSSDNCSLADTVLSKSAFDCSNVGSPVNIDITLNDVSGNSTVKTITVTVQDAISPGLSVQNHTLQLDATGNATLKASDVVTDAYDDCAIADSTLSKTAFDCSNIGTPVNVDVTVSDVHGNSTTYPVTITVIDNVDPILSVQNHTLQIDASGSAKLVLNDVVTTASDNCSVADTALSQTNFDCSNIGTPVIVNVTLSDASGNSVTEQVTITVDDKVAPEIISTHNDITISDEGNCEATLPDYTGTVIATDNCDASLSVSQFPAPGTIISGLVPVILTVTDDSGNEAETIFNLYISDNTNPELAVQDYTLQLNNQGNAILEASNVVVSATDNCIIADTTLSKSNFDCSNIGTPVQVDITLTDAAGNEDTKQVTITVEDNIDPEITTLADITDECSVTLTAPTTIDNCAGTISATTDDPMTYNTQGTYTLTWTFDDGHGNSIDVNQNVIIEDVTMPTIQCHEDTTIDLAQGESVYKVIATELDYVSSNDNCNIAIITNDFNDSESLKDAELPSGTTTINWTITDDAGNENTCTCNVTVNIASGTTVISANEIVIYPNPASNYLRIKNKTIQENTISIYDLTGKLINTYKMFDSEKIIDISSFVEGIYFINVKNENQNKTFKIIKE